MGKLAQQLSKQSQVKVFADGGKVSKFEKSKKDVETRGKGKEGSKKEEAYDRMQMKKCGGKVSKK